MRESEAIDLARLAAARLQLHYGAQLLAAIHAAWRPAQPDDGHMALTWDASGEVRGAQIPGATPWHAALHAQSLTVIIETAHDRRTVPLEGLTRAEALAHVQALLDDTLGADTPRLAYPAYDLPAHPLAEGAPFGAADPDAMGIWIGWFDHAADLLNELRADHPTAQPTRLWPHHFDMAVLIPLPDAGDATGRSVTVGLSGGDAAYAEPYWYVTPWPAPGDTGALPPCDGEGHWHTDGFVAAVLPSHDVHGYPEGQVRAFVATALPNAKALAGT